VTTLFLADDTPCWGRVTTGGVVEVHDTAEPGDDDLLETAALAVVATNGEVYPDAADIMPAGADTAALLRW
jgi:hypothetical protein